MIFKYLYYIIVIQGIYGILGNIFLFPIAYKFRTKIRKNKKPKLLYGLLHDYQEHDTWGDYGDVYFNPEKKKTFLIAWKWVWRNPIHNWRIEQKFMGRHSDFVGWDTCQRDNAGHMWRTPKTKDENDVFQDKNGKYMDFDKGVYGKQRVRFKVGEKKVFRYSGATPRKLWGNLYWVLAYKFGYESKNWAIQFQPFTFLRLKEGDSFELVKKHHLLY